MVDPLTALGAAAAASQFVAQGLKITIYFYQAFQRIKEAPENIRKALAEVEQLISISKLIIQNESLQTDSIASTLSVCLRDATRLETILRKASPTRVAGKVEKLRKAIIATFKEDSIAKLLAGLDREKMNLSLCMHEINSSLLSSIGIQIQGAQTTAGELLLVVNDSARNVQTVVDVLSGVAGQVTTMHDTVPEISDKLSMISAEALPSIISLIQAKHEEMMAVLNGPSRTGGYFNVPNRLSPHFVGREDVLRRLHELCGQDRLSSSTIVLRALGGQGKSQVAMKFCQETRGSFFISTFWVDASSDISIKKDFQLFCMSSRTPSSEIPDSADAIAAYTRDGFERMNEPWLIVFNNLNGPENMSLIRDFIPLNKLSVILITSRHADAAVLASPQCTIELEALPEITASELLLAVASPDEDSASYIDFARAISAKLSNNPLAIAQAGTYIKRRRIPLAQFLDHYNRHLRRVLSENHLQLSIYRRRLNDEEKATSLSVFATWELSLAQFKEDQDSPKMYKEDLLNLLGFSYSTDVSEDMFSLFCANIGPWGSVDEMRKSPGSFLAEHLGCWDSESYVEILDEFCDLSLIQNYHRREDGFYQASVHSLVKDWIMLRLPEDQSAEYRILMMEILMETMNRTDRQSYMLPPDLDHHILGSNLYSDHTPDSSGQPPKYLTQPLKRLVLAQNSLLETMFEAGHYHHVVNLGWRLLALNKDIFKKCTLETVRIGSIVAEALGLRHRFAQSETLAQEILKDSIRLDGIKSKMSQYIIWIIVKALRDTGKYQDSVTLCEQFVDWSPILQGSHDAEDLEVILDLLGLAQHLCTRTPEEISAKCVEVRGILLGLPESRDARHMLAQCGLILGFCHSDLHQYDDAVEEFCQAQQLYRETLGSHHPQTVKCLADAARALSKGTKYEESERTYAEVDKLLQATPGPNHGLTLVNRSWWGWCLWKQGKLDGAEKFRTAYEEYMGIADVENINTLTTLQCLALVLRDKGLKPEARDAIRQHFKRLQEDFSEEELQEEAEEILEMGVDDF